MKLLFMVMIAYSNPAYSSQNYYSCDCSVRYFDDQENLFSVTNKVSCPIAQISSDLVCEGELTEEFLMTKCTNKFSNEINFGFGDLDPDAKEYDFPRCRKVLE